MFNISKEIQRLYKQAQDNDINVGLEIAENSDRYKKFKAKIKSDLFEQVANVARNENYIDTLLMLAKTDNHLQDQAAIFLAYAAINQDWKIAIPSYLMWAGSQGGQTFLDKVGIEAVFGLQNRKFIEYFNDHSRLVIDSVNDTTAKWLANVIQESKQNGLAINEIIDTIVSEGKDMSRIRAERIVLTETANAMSLVEIEAAKRIGVDEMIWRTSRDERVCPICGPLYNKRAKIGQEFAPGITRNPAHVQCRCYLDEVLPENWTVPSQVWLGA